GTIGMKSLPSAPRPWSQSTDQSGEGPVSCSRVSSRVLVSIGALWPRGAGNAWGWSRETGTGGKRGGDGRVAGSAAAECGQGGGGEERGAGGDAAAAGGRPQRGAVVRGLGVESPVCAVVA